MAMQQYRYSCRRVANICKAALLSTRYLREGTDCLLPVLSSLKTTGVLLGGGGHFNEVDVLKSGWLSHYLNWGIIASVRCRGRNGAAALIPPLMQIARAIYFLSL